MCCAQFSQVLNVVATLLRSFPSIGRLILYRNIKLLHRAAVDAARPGPVEVGQRLEAADAGHAQPQLQAALRADGYGVRVYIPYGREWFPYFMRRLGERPANVLFVLKSLLRER